jgi:hypothetical protein
MRGIPQGGAHLSTEVELVERTGTPTRCVSCVRPLQRELPVGVRSPHRFEKPVMHLVGVDLGFLSSDTAHHKAFGLQCRPHFCDLVTLNLDHSVFDGPAGAAGCAQFLRDSFDHRHREMSRKVVSYYHRFSAAMSCLPAQENSPWFPKWFVSFRPGLAEFALRFRFDSSDLV